MVLINNLMKSENSCQFFDGFGIIIQGLLGLICVSTLLIKRALENPKRSLLIWGLDTSKQVIVQLAIHFTNAIFSSLYANFDNLICECYLLMLVFDVIVGSILSWILLKLLMKLLSGTKLEYESGDYGRLKNNGNVDYKCFVFECLWWFLINMIIKVFAIFFILILFRTSMPSFKVMGMILSNHIKIKVVLTLIVIPVTLNSIYFWIADQIIKAKTEVNENTDKNDAISNGGNLPNENNDEENTPLTDDNIYKKEI